ncbi:MRS2-G [Symbiodinium sp. KB8]|nr:MRS2-G [Symbiodinium sp. KB8]
MSAYRNHLIHRELQLTIAGFSIALPTAIAGVFGMNLTSGLEEAQGLFWPITAGSALAGCLVFWGLSRAIARSSPTSRQYHRLQDFIIGIEGNMQDAASTLRIMRRKAEAGQGGDMAVSRDQFKRLQAAATGREPSDDEMKLLYDMFDANDDGLLELDEALSLLDAPGGGVPQGASP